MKTYLSMLRGINVSGQKKIPMEALKKLYESLGFKNVRTYIQSGNVLFECPDKNVPALISRIEKRYSKPTVSKRLYLSERKMNSKN